MCVYDVTFHTCGSVVFIEQGRHGEKMKRNRESVRVICVSQRNQRRENKVEEAETKERQKVISSLSLVCLLFFSHVLRGHTSYAEHMTRL